MPAGKKYECLVGITEYDKKAGTKKVFEPGDEYTGDNADWHLNEGDVNTGPTIREKTSSSSSSAAADKSEEK